MKTLKQICKTAGYYVAADIPAKWLAVSGFKDYVEGRNTIPAQLLEVLGPDYEIGEFYECGIRDEGKKTVYRWIESYSSIFIKHKDKNLVMQLRENRGKFYFYQANFQTRSTVHGKFKYTEPDPNSIGVFTQRKIDDWYKHLNNRYTAALLFTAKCEQENKDIEVKITNTIKAMPRCRVIKNGNYTCVETKLFEIEYNHDRRVRYLQTKIKFKGTIDDIVRIHNTRL